MANEVFKRQLEQLHRELQAIKEVDAATLDSLQRLANEIRELMERKDSEGMPAKNAVQSISAQIEQLESEHPTVTRVLSQMTDFLAMLGI